MSDDNTRTLDRKPGFEFHVGYALGGESYRIIERDRGGGRLSIRLSMLFRLEDAGKVVVDGGIRDYGSGRPMWVEASPNFFIPTSSLINRFEQAIGEIVKSHPAHQVSRAINMEVSFLDHQGLPWGQTSDPLSIRPVDVFVHHRWSIIDRAMRLQRHTSRRLLNVPCEYENLKRIAVKFDFIPLAWLKLGSLPFS
jgi:hypothetical protein